MFKSLLAVLTVLMLFGSAARVAVAGEKPALPAKQQKMMLALYRGHANPDFEPDLQALRDGPAVEGQVPTYFSFGADGCLASVVGEPDLASLDFRCRFDTALWSLQQVFAEIGQVPADFGLEADRPTVLVFVPEMFRANCRSCQDALPRATELARKLEPQVQLIEVDVAF